ncbi:MAG: hypothetical protein LH615_07520 [Ferruginibacter sp.]|nr:hypothetical protein [Ferruginibacter sp.]
MKQLTRAEMKKIMGGDEELPPADGGCDGSCSHQWADAQVKKQTTTGSCRKDTQNHCYCSTGAGTGCGI